MATTTAALVSTERLDLRLLPVDDLVTLFEDPENPGLWAHRPYRNPHRVLMDDAGPLAWRVDSVRLDPAVNVWLVRLIVLREVGEVIGYVNFHDAPDPVGMIEVGVTIHPAFRGHGYAKEALRGLWGWAIDQAGVRVLRYTVSPDNAPSVHIVRGFGFELVGRQIDEIDGPEDIYELPATEFRAGAG
jgi:[ribosomal protein S5]-alanine N-acetyltransferase